MFRWIRRKVRKVEKHYRAKRRQSRKPQRKPQIIYTESDEFDLRGYVDESGDAMGVISPIDVSSQDDMKPCSFVMARARQMQQRRSRTLLGKMFLDSYYPGSYPMVFMRDDVDNDTRGSAGATSEWLFRHCPNPARYRAMIETGADGEELMVPGTESLKDLWEKDRAHWKHLVPVEPSDRSPSPHRKAMDSTPPFDIQRLANAEDVWEYLQDGGIVPAVRVDGNRASVTTKSSYKYPSDLESASTFRNSSGWDEREWSDMYSENSSEMGTWSVDLLSIRDLHDHFSSGDENDRDLFKPGNFPKLASKRNRVSKRSSSLNGSENISNLPRRDRTYVMGKKDFDRVASRLEKYEIHSVHGRVCTTRPLKRLEPVGLKWIKKHQGVIILDKLECLMIPGRPVPSTKQERRSRRKKRRLQRRERKLLKARLRKSNGSTSGSDAVSQLSIPTKFF
ncbi:uncharacterized protein LOC142337804 [Convolutriloba macropyga]|uniref:uncharacterized protein LOC142337804 n=1 Tax=Convolutriloba macropyga TaxID=536237 RepID=UPI003F51CE35